MNPKKILLFLFLLSLLMTQKLLSEQKSIIDFDINGDGQMEKIIISQNNIVFCSKEANGNIEKTHIFEYETKKTCIYNQFDIIDSDSEVFTGKNSGSIINLKEIPNKARYSIIRNTSSKEKFIISDLNKDGLFDFVRIKEPSVGNPNLYEQQIYYQGRGCSFSNKPNKIIKTKGSSFISGLYYDINNDGLLEKVEIKYKYYGAFLNDIKCIISIYFLDNENELKKDPDICIVSSGIFDENINFRDINKDGFLDVVIVDMPNKPKSLLEAISKLFERRMDISLKFYLFDKTTQNYPQLPNFTKQININILRGYSISLDNDYNSDGYPDLLITQSNISEKYLFDPQSCAFK